MRYAMQAFGRGTRVCFSRCGDMLRAAVCNFVAFCSRTMFCMAGFGSSVVGIEIIIVDRHSIFNRCKAMGRKLVCRSFLLRFSSFFYPLLFFALFFVAVYLVVYF